MNRNDFNPVITTLSPDEIDKDRLSSQDITAWIKRSLTTDGNFDPHFTVYEETALPSQTTENAYRLTSGITIREIFVPQSKTLLVGTEKQIKPILNTIFTSTDIKNYKFKDTTWLDGITYPVFGEVLIDSYATKGERLFVDVDIAMQIDTILLGKFDDQDKTKLNEILFNHVFSGSKNITSTSTLVLPGVWLIGKTKYDILTSNLLRDQIEPVSEMTTCIVRIRNTDSQQVKTTFNLITISDNYTNNDYEYIPLSLPSEGTEDLFGIFPDSKSTIESILGMEGVKQNVYSLLIKSGQEIVLRIYQNSFFSSEINLNNDDLRNKFIKYKLEDNELFSIQKENLIFIDSRNNKAYGPWDNNDNILIFPYLFAIETETTPSLLVTVDFSFIGQRGK